MRLRHKPGAKDFLEKHPEFVTLNPTDWKGKWGKRFGNTHPIHLEIGTGKGRFIVEMAKTYPEINFIGIELQTSVVISVLEKQLEEKLPNLQILQLDAANLKEFFEVNEVARIYLNFSDPWPKNRHEKRRLTYRTFLESYSSVMDNSGELILKTDNQNLFEYSLVSFSEFGMTLKEVWLNLHESSFEGNIMTEYEEKFSKKGNRIYRVIATFNN
ncbi:tRNA (guanosine(46)-N7)-methyltransferase TrmB [Lacticigenium naphthae]|uniref:tRNA (guanosine(46)-N7)-methyltransferase TrmB n=1 Tax=Lacticigenium naphthae TaxID=515351 RepID=UPI0003F89D8F|nr:tRNA (guanosine(46)-N7)-methyltransferase TrmB [Lacticigenium naphthae]